MYALERACCIKVKVRVLGAKLLTGQHIPQMLSCELHSLLLPLIHSISS
jgi:hypothetical protein